MLKREISEAIDINKKVDYNDDFELVILRWKYFLKSPNPTNERLEQFRPLIEKVSKETYNKFRHVFGIIGFELEDVINISRCHAVNYMGIFSIEENSEQLEKFVKTYKRKNGENTYPTEKDIRNKNMYNFSKFLVQRLEEVGKIVFTKNRSIRGTGEVFKIYESKNPIMCEDEALIDNCEKYNFKEMTKKRYKELKTKNSIKHDEGFYNNKTLVRVVKIAAKDVVAEDYYESFMNPDNQYYKSPEKQYMDMEYKAKMALLEDTFNSFTPSKKVSELEKFIKDNKSSDMKDEISQARKMLKDLKKGKECKLQL